MNDLIKVLTFPYSSEPVVMEIENNIHEMMQIVEGKVDDFRISDDYILIASASYDPGLDDYKYQKEYGIYGNFIVARYSENGFESMTDDDISNVKNNMHLLLKLRA